MSDLNLLFHVQLIDSVSQDTFRECDSPKNLKFKPNDGENLDISQSKSQ